VRVRALPGSNVLSFANPSLAYGAQFFFWILPRGRPAAHPYPPPSGFSFWTLFFAVGFSPVRSFLVPGFNCSLFGTGEGLVFPLHPISRLFLFCSFECSLWTGESRRGEGAIKCGLLSDSLLLHVPHRGVIGDVGTKYQAGRGFLSTLVLLTTFSAAIRFSHSVWMRACSMLSVYLLL